MRKRNRQSLIIQAQLKNRKYFHRRILVQETSYRVAKGREQ